MNTYGKDQLEVGMVVMVADQKYNHDPLTYIAAPPESNTAAMGKECVVVIIQDVPGKEVGVFFKEPVRGGHTLDGLCPEGHGLWFLAGHLCSPEVFAVHKKAIDSVEERRKAAALAVKNYLKQ